MRFVSLFSGIGGIDLGLERAGMTCVAQSEIDPYACKVLAKHWPDVPNLGDITEIDWRAFERTHGRPDLVAGGFPCQPVSGAGQQKGEEDARWLWPEYARCLRELQPRWVFIENVPGLLTSHDGREAQAVFGTLSELGFDAEWASVPAAAFGAPHLRYRVCILAHARGERLRLEPGGGGGQGGSGPLQPAWNGEDRALAHAQPGGVADADRVVGASATTCDWGRRAIPGPETVERTLRLSGSLGGVWLPEPNVGRVADGVPNRVDRLKCLGNAVVPQLSQWVGELILAADAEMERAA